MPVQMIHKLIKTGKS